MVGQLIILYRNFTFNATKYAIKCSEVTPACFTVYKVTDLLVVGNISGYKKKSMSRQSESFRNAQTYAILKLRFLKVNSDQS